jgi:hypothetical protein
VVVNISQNAVVSVGVLDIVCIAINAIVSVWGVCHAMENVYWYAGAI